jgi:hypothetical protein
MFRTIIGLVSFANAGKTVVTIDDTVANIPTDYARWAATEAQTAEGKAFINEVDNLYKKASLEIATQHGKVLKPLNEELEIYLDYFTLNKGCKKDKLISCLMKNDMGYFEGDGTFGQCGKNSGCYIKFTNMNEDKLANAEEKFEANDQELEKALK